MAAVTKYRHKRCQSNVCDESIAATSDSFAGLKALETSPVERDLGRVEVHVCSLA